jgi:hypothetical protein
MQERTGGGSMNGKQTANSRDVRIEAGAALSTHFNAAASVPKLVFLVSPTCDVCVSGALSATQSVLSLPPPYDFRLYLLWLPVLVQDTIEAAEVMRARLPTDPRTRHFWDHDLIVSQAYYQVLQFARRQHRHRVAWDLFLLYQAGAIWGDVPPVPDFWMHQLFLDDIPKLEVDILRGELRKMLDAEQLRSGESTTPMRGTTLFIPASAYTSSHPS